MRRLLAVALATFFFAHPSHAAPAWGTEVHNRLGLLPGQAPAPAAAFVPAGAATRTAAAAAAAAAPVAAITLDACGGGFDADLIALLVARRVPATIFVTKKWLDHNPVGTAKLLAHPDLFELEDHGTQHVPAVIGPGRRVYGITGQPDAAHLRDEISGAAKAIERLTGHAPHYFRGATAIYDAQSLKVISDMGYEVAGFSVNADGGATLPQATIVKRLAAVQGGDVILAHMNKPAGFTAEAFAVALPGLLARGIRFVKLSQARLLPG